MCSLSVLAGCGGSPVNKIAGTWRVDPASITTTRLARGAESRPDWTDATKILGGVEVVFSVKPESVEVTGLGEKSTGTWSLSGSKILVQSKDSGWPTMLFDSVGPRIHLTMERVAGRLQMDLFKVK